MALETEMTGLAAQRRTSEDLAALRACLDRMTAARNVEELVKADADFHASIARASKNPYYSRFTDFLGIRLVPNRAIYLPDHSDPARQAYARSIHEDHVEIFDAIVAGDEAAARLAARTHMQKSLERHRGRQKTRGRSRQVASRKVITQLSCGEDERLI